MTSPEELIGKKSKRHGSTKEDTTDKQSYVIRYSSPNLLVEAVLIAGQPKFIVAKKNCDSVSIQDSIIADGRILKPLRGEAYLSKPYSFSSEQMITECMNKAKCFTRGDIYDLVKSICQLFIFADNNHISLLTAGITYTHDQDRLKLTHYLFFVGKPGSGKSNNLALIQLLGYRTFMSTDMTSSNIYQFLGSQEEAIGTLCIDEANSIDENKKIMEILKTGYVTGGRVARTDTSNGRIQNAYYTFGYKAFAGERLPDSITANGFNERLIPISCFDGTPKYDITEIISPAGEPEYQELFDQLEHTRNLLFIHRLIHWFEPIPAVRTQLRGREKQLFISLMRMYYNESVWPAIKSVICHYILERRGKQMDTLHAYLYGLINRLINANDSFQLKSSAIWDRLKSELDGKEIVSKPHSYSTERYGIISQKQVTKILKENFGADKPLHHGDANQLIFNRDILERLKNTYEVEIDVEANIGIDGDDGDDSKYGMNKFVESNSTTSTEKTEDINNISSVVSVNGIDGIDGMDNSDDVDNSKEIGSLDSQTDVNTNNLSSICTDHSLTSTDNQIRRATATSMNNISSPAKDLSHLSQVSQILQQSNLTREIIEEFFYDDGRPYCPPPSHTLDESPCKSIIKIDAGGFYYCTLHSDIRNIHLETIEHHVKFKDAKLHESEILKRLDN
jgi:hypothetical protein